MLPTAQGGWTSRRGRQSEIVVEALIEAKARTTNVTPDSISIPAVT